MTTAATATQVLVPPPPSREDAPAGDRFPDFPPRTDMMNTTHLHDYGNQPSLRLHLGDLETTVVLGEVPIHWDVPFGLEGVRVPDLLVAFRIRRARIIEQKGYSIREQGKPPDLVLEVASDSTAENDELDKRLEYADFGITEYWMFDPDWGRRYTAGLMGWTLVGNRYEPIAVHRYAPDMYYAWSAVLGLYVCWEYGRLRWYDPAAGAYLLTHDEEHSNRIAAEVRRDAAETQREQERRDRLAAEAQREQERSERMAAEAQREQERSDRIAAEAEVQRLQEEIARLRAGES